MKLKPILILCFVISVLSQNAFSQIQKNIGVANQHYHDLNIELIKDGSNDFVVAGNLFDSPVLNEELALKRIDANGNVIWIQKYNITGLLHPRAFDVVSIGDTLFVTGSADVNSIKKVFIAKILATNGTLLASSYYDILSPNLHSRGLHIIYSTADVNGDGAPDQGLVVSGFFSDCFQVNVGCTNNFGFVMRTDLNLIQTWTAEIDSNVPLSPDDYDMANHVTETIDGYFVTGSATAANAIGGFQQGVLAHKLDFMGNQVWDSSYWFGNSRDVSVDAYYDNASQNIYMLVNYSSTHYFGITCLSNATGVVDFTRTWYANDPDLDRYGFTLMESSASVNNLIISGYDRSEQWSTLLGFLIGESNIFVYEFDKTTGNSSGTHFQYLVPHIEPGADEFNFWTAQLPLIYYPDISFQNSSLPGTIADYYHVGYRTLASTNFTDTEIFKTDNTKVNLCDHLNISPAITTPAFNAIQPSSGLIPTSHVPIQVVPFALARNENICDLYTGIEDLTMDQALTLLNNPAQGEILIGLAAEFNGTVTVELINLMGQIIDLQNYSSLTAGSRLSFGTNQIGKRDLHCECDIW